ncbi:unnamed protein product, partial [Oikopleura dioica]
GAAMTSVSMMRTDHGSFYSRNKTTPMPDRAAEVAAHVNQKNKEEKHRGFKDPKFWIGGAESFCQILRLQKERHRVSKCFILRKPQPPQQLAPNSDENNKNHIQTTSQLQKPSDKKAEPELTLREQIDQIHKQFPTATVAGLLKKNLMNAKNEKSTPTKKQISLSSSSSSNASKKIWRPVNFDKCTLKKTTKNDEEQPISQKYTTRTVSPSTYQKQKQVFEEKRDEIHAKYNVSEESQYLMNLIYSSTFSPHKCTDDIKDSKCDRDTALETATVGKNNAKDNTITSKKENLPEDYDSDSTTISITSDDESTMRVGPGSYGETVNFCGNKNHLVFEESESEDEPPTNEDIAFLNDINEDIDAQSELLSFQRDADIDQDIAEIEGQSNLCHGFYINKKIKR